MNATTTAKATRIMMRNGFDGVLISVEESREEIPHFTTDAAGQPTGVELVDSPIWIVTVVGVYSTTRGDQVGEVKTHSFGVHDDARASANGWFNHLKSKGYYRTV